MLGETRVYVLHHFVLVTVELASLSIDASNMLPVVSVLICCLQIFADRILRKLTQSVLRAIS